MHNCSTSKIIQAHLDTAIAETLLFFHLVCWSVRVFLQPHGLPSWAHHLCKECLPWCKGNGWSVWPRFQTCIPVRAHVHACLLRLQSCISLGFGDGVLIWKISFTMMGFPLQWVHCYVELNPYHWIFLGWVSQFPLSFTEPPRNNNSNNNSIYSNNFGYVWNPCRLVDLNFNGPLQTLIWKLRCPGRFYPLTMTIVWLQAVH